MCISTFATKTLRLSLGIALLPLALYASDAVAVVVNPDGTTQFNYAVSGPNLLGTKTPTPITTTTTLSAAVPGTLYRVSGTAGPFTITLPPAGIGDGTVLAFSVAPWATATQQYTIVPVSGQTLDGRSNGLMLIYTNYLEIMSVDGQWVSRIKKVDTDWSQPAPIDLSATIANPTAGPGLNAMRWRRRGGSCECEFRYSQTNKGTSGSGTYLFGLPFVADVNINPVHNSTTHTLSAHAVVGSISYAGENIHEGYVTLYTDNKAKAWFANPEGDGTFDSNRGGLGSRSTITFGMQISYSPVSW